ncbi:hypothetical protein ACOSP7_000842 [Xanthoceras sorbifolium]
MRTHSFAIYEHRFEGRFGFLLMTSVHSANPLNYVIQILTSSSFNNVTTHVATYTCHHKHRLSLSLFVLQHCRTSSGLNSARSRHFHFLNMDSR